ncbi:MAG: SGNH/GDSL hydrolase family protein [Planctomycetota bacterium]
MEQRFRLLKRMALVLLGPLVLFGLLELGLRIGGYRFDPWAAFAGGEAHDELAEARIYAPDRELLWTLRRDAVIDVPAAGFDQLKTNSLGFRGPEFPEQKASGEFLVLCLGDSVTFGLGLADVDTWPAWLAKALRAAPELAGRPVRVINGAVPGWSSVQGMRLLARMKDLQPDVVVFWFGINDAKEARGVPDSEFVAPSAAAVGAIRLLRRSRVFQLLQQALVGTRSAASGARRVSPEEFRAAVQRLRDGARSGGPAPVFVRCPESMARTISELGTVVAQAEQEGVTFVIGHKMLLSPVVPAMEGTRLTGRVVVAPEGRALLFAEGPGSTTRTLAEVKADLGQLRALKQALDGLMPTLPETSLGYADLFGAAAPGSIFKDNCHLEPFGARLAGQAVARAVLRIVRAERER